jgi:Tfp pilus assembly protein PilO
LRLITISPENQQRLAVLVPLVALALSLFVVYPAWGRYSDLQSKIEQQQQELNTLKSTPVPEPGPVRPAAEAQPTEPPQFLAQIAFMAAVAHARIIGFDLVPAEGARESGTVRAVRAKIDLEGQYYQMREFLAQLARADRLYVVADMNLTPSGGAKQAAPGGSVHATFTIERYVTPRASQSGAAPNP